MNTFLLETTAQDLSELYDYSGPLSVMTDGFGEITKIIIILIIIFSILELAKIILKEQYNKLLNKLKQNPKTYEKYKFIVRTSIIILSMIALYIIYTICKQ